MLKLTRYDCLILMSLITLSTCGSLLLFPNLPTLTLSFHLPSSAANVSILSYMLGTTLSQILTAYGFNRVRWLDYLSLSLIWIWAGCFIAILALHHHHFLWFCFGRMLQGIGAGTSYLLPFVLIAHHLDYQQARPFYAYANFGFAIWPYLAIFLGSHLTHQLGIDDTLLSFALYASLLVLLTHFSTIRTLPYPLRPKTTMIARSKILLGQPKLLLGAMATGALSSALYLYLSMSPHLAFTALQFPSSLYGTWQLISGLSALLGHSFAVSQAKRGHPIKLLQLALVIATLGILSLWLVLIIWHKVTPLTFFILPSILALVAPVLYANVIPLATKHVPYPIEANMLMTLSNHLFTLVCLGLSMLIPNVTLVEMVGALTISWTMIGYAILRMTR
jgi:MFS family permease